MVSEIVFSKSANFVFSGRIFAVDTGLMLPICVEIVVNGGSKSGPISPRISSKTVFSVKGPATNYALLIKATLEAAVRHS